MCAACMSGNLKLVAYLLNSGKGELNAPNKEDKSPFYFACWSGNMELCIYLKEAGADIAKVSKYDRTTPLIAACHNGKLDVARWLHGMGADINECDRWGQSPFYHGCESGNVKLVVYLEDAGADILKVSNYDRTTPLMAACRRGRVDVARCLHGMGVDINECDRWGQSPFIFSCESGNMELCIYLKEAGADIAKVSKYDRTTPLIAACRNGKLDVARWLHGMGASVNVRDKEGRSPLYYACLSGKVELAKVLVDAGAEVHSSSRHSPQDAARESGHGPMVEYLRTASATQSRHMPSTKHGSPSVSCLEWCTAAVRCMCMCPVVWSCGVYTFPDIAFSDDLADRLLGLQYLFSVRRSPPCCYGCCVCAGSHLEDNVAKVLYGICCESDEFLVARNSHQMAVPFPWYDDAASVAVSARMLLCCCGLGCAGFQLADGCTDEQVARCYGWDGLPKALCLCPIGCPYLWLTGWSQPNSDLFNSIDGDRTRFQNYYCPRLLACIRIAVCGSCCFDVDSKHAGDDSTGLHGAAREGAHLSALLLLLYGADINAQNTAGDTPLLLAARKQRRAMSQLLLERGARLYTMNDHGESAADFLSEDVFAGWKEGGRPTVAAGKDAKVYATFRVGEGDDSPDRGVAPAGMAMDRRTDGGWSSLNLHAAAKYGNTERLRRLLPADRPIDGLRALQALANNETPFELACRYGRTDSASPTTVVTTHLTYHCHTHSPTTVQVRENRLGPLPPHLSRRQAATRRGIDLSLVAPHGLRRWSDCRRHRAPRARL